MEFVLSIAMLMIFIITQKVYTSVDRLKTLLNNIIVSYVRVTLDWFNKIRYNITKYFFSFYSYETSVCVACVRIQKLFI